MDFDENSTTSATVTDDTSSDLFLWEQRRDVTVIHRTSIERVVVGILLLCMITVTISGNLLVCVTVVSIRQLHSTTNYFIFSLALSDLLLGCLVLPFSALNAIDRWRLGQIICNIHISCDVMLCTVSILTLFVISVDRYLSLTLPLRYRGSITTRKVRYVNVGVWTFSFLMAFVPIHLGWNTPTGEVQYAEDPPPSRCELELNRSYALVISIGTYFTPLIVMCVIYQKIFQITHRQVMEINSMYRPMRSIVSAIVVLQESGQTLAGFRSAAMIMPLTSSETQRHSLATTSHVTTGRHPPRGVMFFRRRLQSDITRRQPAVRQPSFVASEQKASVTLACVLLAFVVCWAPYFIMFMLRPFGLVNGRVHLELFVLWLGYFNSTVNPFLYAFYNAKFRHGFRKVLCNFCR